MQLLLILGAFLLPLAMFAFRRRPFSYLYDGLAALALLAANITAGIAVLEIKAMNTEMTTHIHEIFNNPLFLASAGYIGLYSTYRLLCTTARTWKQKKDFP